MTVEQLRTWYYTEPFKPFALRLNDGRSVLVAKRDWIGISPTERFATVVQEDESFAFIDLASVLNAQPVANEATLQP